MARRATFAGFEFEAASYTVAENAGMALIPVRRGSDATNSAAAVNYATSDGTAKAGEPVTDDEPTLDLVTDVAGLDTIVTRYPNHRPGGAVEQWTMTGGPHRPSFTANYAPAIIDWLLAHPKP